VWIPKRPRIEVSFDGVRDERTVLVAKAVTIGNTTYATRKDGRPVAFGLSRSRHFRASDRGALNYIEAAWRLGIVPKATYDRYDRLAKEKQARDHVESTAANALEYLNATGIVYPATIRRELEKLSGK
jgi:hypothetical protein